MEQDLASLKEKHKLDLEQQRLDLLASHDHMARRDDNPTQGNPLSSDRTAKSRRAPFRNSAQGRWTTQTPTERSSWRKTPTITTQDSLGQGSWGYEHQPFKALPSPLVNRAMKANLRGFHPFTKEVMKAQLPQRWSWPNLEKYSGTSHPEAHVKTYMMQAQLFS